MIKLDSMDIPSNTDFPIAVPFGWIETVHRKITDSVPTHPSPPATKSLDMISKFDRMSRLPDLT
jgi:hypothetical protein